MEKQVKRQDSVEGDTFWKKKNIEGDGVYQYNIETLQDMQNFLKAQGVSGMSALIFSAESMKCKMCYYLEDEGEGLHKELGYTQNDEIPDYVYKF